MGREGGTPADPQNAALRLSLWGRLVRWSLGLVPKISFLSKGKMEAETRT